MSVEANKYQTENNARKLSIIAQPALHFMVGLWIFSGAFVFFEPSPYEMLFWLLLPLALIARMGVHRNTLVLFFLFAIFIPFAFISAFQVKYNSQSSSLVYVIVTIFLFFTSYFIANYVADAPFERMKTIMVAYMATALISSTLGTLGYLGIIPGSDILVGSERARAMFKDPNVFGPFLILPAMYALQRLLLDNSRKALWAAMFFGILFIGVFVSFSRAAWGSILLASILVFALCFWYEACARQKVRMLILAMAGCGLAVVALVGLVSIPSVGDLFLQRANIIQSYDGGETGRFGRQKYALELAIEHPLGLGPLEFRNLRIGEEPHNTFVNVVHAYGWGGGFAFIIMMLLTLRRGVAFVGKNSPNRLLMIPLVATYIPLMIESVIIDIDHWRSFFLLVGLIWGVSAGYSHVSDAQKTGKTAYI